MLYLVPSSLEINLTQLLKMPANAGIMRIQLALRENNFA